MILAGNADQFQRRGNLVTNAMNLGETRPLRGNALGFWLLPLLAVAVHYGILRTASGTKFETNFKTKEGSLSVPDWEPSACLLRVLDVLCSARAN